MLKELSSSKHHFSGDMLVFRGVHFLKKELQWQTYIFKQNQGKDLGFLFRKTLAVLSANLLFLYLAHDPTFSFIKTVLFSFNFFFGILGSSDISPSDFFPPEKFPGPAVTTKNQTFPKKTPIESPRNPSRLVVHLTI